MKKMMTTLATLLVLVTSNAGELYVKVNSTVGSMYASFDNQQIYNQTGIFRFFEVSGQANFLLIRRQVSQQVVADVPLQIPFNQRWIGEINHFGQFVLLKTEQLNYISWYAEQNPYTQTMPAICTTPMPNPYAGSQNWSILSHADYLNFKEHLDNEAFDSGKLSVAKNFVQKTRISAAQIAGIAEEFTFDSDRLKWAKYAYDFCYDPVNYYNVSAVFTFSSSKTELEQYLAGK